MNPSIPPQLQAAYAEEVRDHLAALRQALEHGVADDPQEAYRHVHSLKGAARAVELPEVEALAHGLETLFQVACDGRSSFNAALVRAAAAALDAIEDLSAVSSPTAEKGASPEMAAAIPAPAILKVEAEGADRVMEVTAALLAELDRHDHAVRPFLSLPGEAAAITAEHVAVLADCRWALEQLGKRLREAVHLLRLVSAESLLGNFGPMVRDIAAVEGKQVAFRQSGLGVLADRSVLSALNEAVLHLLRNAVAHGVETPAQRLSAGKDPVGQVSLSAELVGSRLVVRVADDGRGLNIGAIATAAASGGMDVNGLEDEGVRYLIFHPGLSTASQVGPVAGRGMGMSIVRQVINALQGSLSMESTPGKGMVVALEIPVSLLSLTLVLLRAGGEIFAVPSAALAGVARIERTQTMPVEGRLRAEVNGRDMPLVDLADLLDLPGRAESLPMLSVAVLNDPGGPVGLVVDACVDVREMPVSALDEALTDDSRLAGTVMLENGGLALVLAPAGMAAAAAAIMRRRGA